MVRLIIVSSILLKCIFISYCQQYDSKILCELIAGEKSIITDCMNPADSLYRIEWQEFYDLEGTHTMGASNMNLVIYTKYDGIIRVGYLWNENTNFEKIIIQQKDISIETRLRIDSIIRHEYARYLNWRQQMDVPTIIKGRAGCTLNELEYAGIIGLSIFYEVTPKGKDCKDTTLE